MPSWPARQGL